MLLLIVQLWLFNLPPPVFCCRCCCFHGVFTGCSTARGTAAVADADDAGTNEIGISCNSGIVVALSLSLFSFRRSFFYNTSIVFFFLKGAYAVS